MSALRMVWIDLSLRWDDGKGNAIGRLTTCGGPTLDAAIEQVREKAAAYNTEVRTKRPQFKKPTPRRT